MKKFQRSVLTAIFGLMTAGISGSTAAEEAPNSTGGEAVQAVAILGDKIISRDRLYDEMYQAGGAQTLDRLVGLLLLEEELVRRKITITEAEIDSAYTDATKQFKEQSGESDMVEVLKSRFGLSVAQYKENVIRLDLALKKLITDEMQVNDADTAAFYFSHREQYQEPEMIRIRHILIDPRGTSTEGNSEMNALGPKQWGDAFKQALELRSRLQEGADFSLLAKENSADPRTRDAGGEIGWVAKGFLNPTLEAACFGLKDSEISDPVKTILGYHLIQRIEYRKAKALSYVAIKDQVRKDYLDTLKRSSGDALIQRLKQEALKEGRLKLPAK